MPNPGFDKVTCEPVELGNLVTEPEKDTKINVALEKSFESHEKLVTAPKIFFSDFSFAHLHIETKLLSF